MSPAPVVLPAVFLTGKLGIKSPTEHCNYLDTAEATVILLEGLDYLRWSDGVEEEGHLSLKASSTIVTKLLPFQASLLLLLCAVIIACLKSHGMQDYI